MRLPVESLEYRLPANAFAADSGMIGRHREVSEGGDAHMLREPAVAYSSHFGHETGPLSAENEVFWEQA